MMMARPDPPLALDGVSAGTLRRIAGALRTGQLASPVTPFALATVLECPSALAEDLRRLSGEGLAAPHLALVLDLAADAVEARMQGEAASELVWSGPETTYARSRDTLVVLEELFSSARRSVLVSTYALYQPERVFATLGARLDAVPALRARLFVHIDRVSGDTRPDDSLVWEYSRKLASAEWAQHRNVEAGVLVRSRHFTAQLRSQFDALVNARQVARVPGL